MLAVSHRTRILSLYSLRFYSTGSNQSKVDSNHRPTGRKQPSQNTFYFEKSPLTTSELANDDKSTNATLYEKIPVVLLLGWTGSTDRQLLKYQSIYSSMGYHVVRFAPSNKLTFFDYDEHPKYVARFLDTLKNDLKLTKNPIITHIFSSACSFILYQHMIKDMARKAECVDWKFFIDNHRAAIFDCGPGRPVAPYQLWHGVAGLNKSLSLPVRYLVSTLFVAYAAVFHYGQLGEHYYTRAFDTVVEDDRLVPALVLYSEKDSVVSSKSVEEMAARRKHLHKGLFLKTVAFKDTDHVLIYNKYKEEYVKYINEHLNMCKLDINTVLKK